MSTKWEQLTDEQVDKLADEAAEWASEQMRRSDQHDDVIRDRLLDIDVPELTILITEAIVLWDALDEWVASGAGERTREAYCQWRDSRAVDVQRWPPTGLPPTSDQLVEGFYTWENVHRQALRVYRVVSSFAELRDPWYDQPDLTCSEDTRFYKTMLSSMEDGFGTVSNLPVPELPHIDCLLEAGHAGLHVASLGTDDFNEPWFAFWKEPTAWPDHFEAANLCHRPANNAAFLMYTEVETCILPSGHPGRCRFAASAKDDEPREGALIRFAFSEYDGFVEEAALPDKWARWMTYLGSSAVAEVGPDEVSLDDFDFGAYEGGSSEYEDEEDFSQLFHELYNRRMRELEAAPTSVTRTSWWTPGEVAAGSRRPDPDGPDDCIPPEEAVALLEPLLRRLADLDPAIDHDTDFDLDVPEIVIKAGTDSIVTVAPMNGELYIGACTGVSKGASAGHALHSTPYDDLDEADRLVREIFLDIPRLEAEEDDDDLDDEDDLEEDLDNESVGYRGL